MNIEAELVELVKVGDDVKITVDDQSIDFNSNLRFSHHCYTCGDFVKIVSINKFEDFPYTEVKINTESFDSRDSRVSRVQWVYFNEFELCSNDEERNRKYAELKKALEYTSI